VGPESVNPGTDTVRGKVVVTVWAPLVPVRVMVEFPGTAVLSADRVSEVLWVTGFSENAPVTPAGRPDKARLTLLEKPYWGFTVTVPDTEFPTPRVKALGPVRSKVGALIDSGMVV
jgi:hypothetical protein